MELTVEKTVEVDGVMICERRGVPRHRVLKGATLTFNRGYGAMECTVRNFCEHGALLRFGDAAGVPVYFDLKISDEMQHRPAHVRWRAGTDIGVAFYAEGLPPVTW